MRRMNEAKLYRFHTINKIANYTKESEEELFGGLYSDPSEEENSSSQKKGKENVGSKSNKSNSVKKKGLQSLNLIKDLVPEKKANKRIQLKFYPSSFLVEGTVYFPRVSELEFGTIKELVLVWKEQLIKQLSPKKISCSFQREGKRKGLELIFFFYYEKNTEKEEMEIALKEMERITENVLL